MRQFDKPRIILSKCLGQAHCRYDGSMISSDLVDHLAPYVEYITVCPEMSIGLPVPREAMRIVRDEKNVLLHVFGYSKNGLNSSEKAFFLENLELYN